MIACSNNQSRLLLLEQSFILLEKKHLHCFRSMTIDYYNQTHVTLKPVLHIHERVFLSLTSMWMSRSSFNRNSTVRRKVGNFSSQPESFYLTYGRVPFGASAPPVCANRRRARSCLFSTARFSATTNDSSGSIWPIWRSRPLRPLSF